MHKVWIIARHEYMVNVRRTGFIITTALVPLLGIVGLLVMTFLGGQVPAFLERQFSSVPKHIGVVDELGDFTPILPAYHARYTLFAEQETGRKAVETEEIAALLVIPQNYMKSGEVLIVSKGSALSAAAMENVSEVRQFFVDHLLRGQQVQPALRERLADPIEPVLVSLGDEGEPEGGALSTLLSIMVPYFLALMLIVTILLASGYLLRGVSEEKTTRVIELLLSSVSAQELLAGKVLGLGALGLTQVVVWMASVIILGSVASALNGWSIPLMSRPEVFALGLVYYLLGFLMYAVLMGSVGALGTTMQESQQMAGIFSLMAAIPIFFAGFVFTNPNMTLIRILSWFPLTAPTAMLLRIPMAEVPVVDIVGSIVMILIAIPVILWAGSKIFRLGLLMYGKRPTLAQVWRTLRQA